MLKIKLTPYRKQEGTIYHRQTKNHSLVSLNGKYQFYIDEPCPDPDFWVVQGKGVRRGETHYVAPQNTILLTTEPRSVLIYPQKYINQFGLVCTCQENTRHPNIVLGPAILPWFCGYTMDANDNVISCPIDYDTLKAMPTPRKDKLISVISSNKAFTQGHINRLHFVMKLQEHFGDKIDVFGRGFNDFGDKWDVLARYKYHIVIENSSQSYYWTEKMSDCLLAETFPFYYGCTNMSDYISKDAYQAIDINKPCEAIDIIERAIATNQYEKAKDALHEAKLQMLDEYNMFEYIAQLCDKLDPSLQKREVTIMPCHSSDNLINLWRYSVARKWYELKWKLLK